MTEFYATDRSYNLLGIFSTTSGKFDTAVAEDVQKIDESARTFQATINWAPSQEVDEPDELTNQAIEMFKEGNFVLYVDKQGKSVWTTIYEVNMDTEDGQADITCQDAGIDLINELVGPYTPDKQYTIAQYIERFTKDSGFEIGVNEIPKLSRKLQGWESTETALARIISVATQFDNAELDFSFEVQGLDVVKKYINIYKKRGGGDNTTLYVGKEINKIVVKSDIYDLATAIYPQGGTEEGKDTPVTLKGYKWTDPDKRFVLGNDGVLRDTVAVQKWSRLLSNENPSPKSAHIVTRKDYETTIQSTLLNNALRNLKEVNEPAVNYEVDIVELPSSVNIGDTINLVNEKRELYLSARVLELTYDYCYGTGTAVLGDYLIQEGRIDTSLQDLANSLKERVDSMREEVKAKTKYIKSTTPPSETENVIWIDTSKTPNIVKTWNEDTQSWDKATPDAPGEVGAYPGDKGDVLEENVNVIQEDVEHVKGEIEDLGDDSKLTVVEKKAVALEIETIKATYAELVKQATKVDVDITDYGNKYKALLAYIQPLLDAVNVNSVIVPVTYKAKFTDYYSAEQNAKNLIGDKIIQLAEQGDENTQLVANTYTDSEIKKADKEIRLAVNQYTDVAVDKAKNEAKIYTAYANSLDGTVDFTREWPRENLLSDSSGEWQEVTFSGWTGGGTTKIPLDSVGLKVGDTITYSVEYDNTLDSVDSKLRCLIYFVDADGKSTAVGGNIIENGKTGISVKTEAIPTGTVRIQCYKVGKSEGRLSTKAAFRNNKLELGSTATPYLAEGQSMQYTGTSVKDSNNPTDYDWAKTSAKHTDVDEAVVIAKKYTDTSISLIPGQITAGVKESKEYADNAANGALAGSKSYTESQIKIVKDEIDLKVDKDGIIGAINVSPEGILIDGAKNHITGQTKIDNAVIETTHIKDAAITSAKIKDIAADKIKAGEVSGLILTSLSETGKFSVEGQHATLENTDTGWKTDIYDNGIYTYNSDHSLRARFTEDIVNSNKFGTSSTNVYLATGGLDGEEGEAAGGEVRAVLYTKAIDNNEDVGSKYEYTYRPFRGEGMVGSYVNLNTAIPGSNNMYLRVPSGKEVKITRIGTVDDFQDIRAKDGYFGSIMQESSDAGNFYIGANGEVRMTSRDGYNGEATVYRDIRAQDARIASIIQKDSGTNFYLGTGGNLRVTSRAGYNGGDTKYKAVEASGFSNKSLATLKTDIFKHQDDALSCINAADIYNYKLKEEVAEAQPSNHIGLIIGDGYNTPDCVKNNDGTAIDIYAMTSVAWKAIQELSDKNETLNNRISDLQSEIDILRREITK